MNGSVQCGILPSDSESINEGIDFTSVSPSKEQHIKIRKLSHCAWPWLQCDCCFVFKMPENSPPFLFNWDVPLSKTTCQCLFCFVTLASLRVCLPICALNSGSCFSPQSGGDLSDSQGSAAYISCQWLELCVFPDQSKACLRSWKAFNVYSSQQEDPQAGFLPASLLLVQSSVKETLKSQEEHSKTIQKQVNRLGSSSFFINRY